MLNSWFGSKSSRHKRTPSARVNVHSDVSSISIPTVGPLQTPANLTSASDVPLTEVHAHINDPSLYATTPSLINSAEKEATALRTPDAPPASLDAATQDGTFFTPQDAIVAQVFGRAGPAHAAPPPPSNAPQPSVSLTTSDSLPLPPSMQTPLPSSSARTIPIPTLPIYDPFSGTKLGERTPRSPFATAQRELSLFSPITAVDDRKLWSSLERILELQAEIAAMHADMEGVGGKASGSNHAGVVGAGAGEGGNVGPRKRSKRGQTLPVGDEEPDEHEPEVGAVAGVAVSEISADHSDGEDEDVEDENDVYGYGKRRRDEEFARLGEQFAQRKVAISGIMNKLDDLSIALKTFHGLPPPLFDLPSSPTRTDTMSSAPSNVSATPLHDQPPLSSTSPFHSSSMTTPLAPSLSLPIPPMSTLAPPLSSGGASASPGVGSIVPPVLPQTMPTIIPGAPHVESPADMGPAHSIFRRLR